MKKQEQIDLVLDAIRAGASIVNFKYLGDVLCLACRGSLTRQEMNRLVLCDGRRVFVESLPDLKEAA